MATTQEVLLPSLKELQWSISSDDDFTFPFIRLFLGPRIKRLHLTLSSDSHVRLSFLHSLHIRYPYLTHVHLVDDPSLMEYGYGDKHRIAVEKAVSNAVCGWDQLRHLSVPCLSPVALHHVATLPTLEQLTLTNVTNPEDASIALPRSHPGRFFSSLQELDLSDVPISFSVALLEAMESSSLTSIKINTFGEENPLAHQDLFNALRNHCCHSSLTSITVHTYEPEYDAGIMSKHLKPIFVFSNLTNVKLYLECPFDLDDATVSDMAQAWPRIRSLVLRGYYPEECKPCVTILGLIPIAQHCPELEELTILFDTRWLPLPTACFPGATSEALKKLQLLNSPIEDPEEVAAFLYWMFPRAEVRFSYWCPDLYGERWRHVSDLIRGYARSVGEL